MELENTRYEITQRISEFFSGESSNPKSDTYKKLLDFEKVIRNDLQKNIDMAYEHGYYDGRVLGKQTKQGKLQSKKGLL